MKKNHYRFHKVKESVNMFIKRLHPGHEKILELLIKKD